MSTWYVYKTKKDVIVVVSLSSDAEGTITITLLDHNIPPSKAELLDIFQADSLHDYIEKMIPFLFKNLKEDPDVIEIYNEIIGA